MPTDDGDWQRLQCATGITMTDGVAAVATRDTVKLNMALAGHTHQTNHGETDVSGCVVASGRAREQRRSGTLVEDTASCSDSATRAACVKRQGVHGVRLVCLDCLCAWGRETNLN